MQSPPLRYRLLLIVLSPVLLLMVLWQAWQVRSRRFALQRLGFAYGQIQPNALWVHCASVGEVQAALPLINRLRGDPQFAPLVVSTATPTGADTVNRQNWPDVDHFYLPVDFPGAVKRAFRRVSPRALLLMETEIWPNLINTAARQDIPVLIVNARLSPRTLDAPQWLQPVYRQALSKLSAILAKSTQDVAGFKQLGAPEDTITLLGNLKFAAISANTPALDNPIERPFWLAASTHEDEELQLCSAMLAKSELASTLLVIAPRHPKRSAAIREQLSSLKVNYAVRSKNEPIDQKTQVYLADTLGEMSLWLQHAKAVFMGGSLVPVGGHNLLEPAAAGVPIVSGPQLHNFLEEAELLRPVGALQPCDTAAEAINAISELLADPENSRQLGAAGRLAVRAQADTLERYRDALLPLVAKQQ